MKCPHCGKDNNRVVNSRPSNNNNAIRRRRECNECSRRFTTYETIVEILPRIKKKDGRREEFDRSKLEQGIKKALEKRPISSEEIEKVIDRIERKLYKVEDKEVYSKYIGELVMEQLKELDPVAYVRFASVYREFKDATDFMEELKHFLENKK
ncbi:MAG: transcriptional repressor NrdR [Candidatus Mcinerneyibacterium aminivorans]|jgi:transcriptional repressor NrdR|uniref:Transcriptional repressor NrdR n=1 Tax=Candidatus Mcinerneyibacterium aminivorans TaxID=2703815 RepID=A0A5D0MMX2_9BACT|nr:MAG: transcriptional repressor NrdR [Candidatus Mcinerneyibacterium aminivorans]